MTKPDKALRLLLRATGVVMASAIFPVFMPLSWMSAVHQWLGMGPLPAGPIVEYLARSLSGMYAVMGGLFWVASGDVRRHRAFILYAGTVMSALAVPVCIMDWAAGMPWFWTAGEASVILAIGVAILVLLRLAARRD